MSSKGNYKWFTSEEIASWPAEHKKCRRCHEVLPFSSFHKSKNTLLGIYNECKICRLPKGKERYANTPRQLRLWRQLKQRAREKNLEFDLTVEDLVFPDKCPVFNQPFSTTPGDPMYPNVDRIDPKRGYIKNNIKIISHKANRIKSDGSVWEVEQVLNYMKNNCKDNFIRTDSMNLSVGSCFNSPEISEYFYKIGVAGNILKNMKAEGRDISAFEARPLVDIYDEVVDLTSK